LIGAAILFLTYHIYYGALYTYVNDFLFTHPDWFITVPMLSLWLLMIGIMVIFFGFLMAAEHYMHYKFILSDYAFHLNRGLFFVRETTIPYQQISNVHIARPYHYRMFGVAQLDIVTAADKSLSHEENKTKQFLIPVIDTKVARGLSEQLIEYASKIREGRDLSEEEDETIDDDLEDIIDNEMLDLHPHSHTHTHIHAGKQMTGMQIKSKHSQHNQHIRKTSFDDIGEIDDITELAHIADDQHIHDAKKAEQARQHKEAHRRIDGISFK
jgi:uncharacterized membrane protein YdbT with pleckstrin-like domain